MGCFLLGNKWFISDLFFKQFRWKYRTENQEQIGEEEKEGEDCGGDWKFELSSCPQVSWNLDWTFFNSFVFISEKWRVI